MATNSQGSLARYNTPQQLTFHRRRITPADAGKTVLVGIVPPNAVILKAMSAVNVSTVFNAGTTNTIDIGVTGTANAFGAALSLTAVGQPALNGTASFLTPANGQDTVVYATVNLTGTAATTGVADIVIVTVPANDLT
jgi:hypothetical protein